MMNDILNEASGETSFIKTDIAVPTAGGCSTSKAAITNMTIPTTRGNSNKYGILKKVKNHSQ